MSETTSKNTSKSTSKATSKTTSKNTSKKLKFRPTTNHKGHGVQQYTPPNQHTQCPRSILSRKPKLAGVDPYDDRFTYQSNFPVFQPYNNTKHRSDTSRPYFALQLSKFPPRSIQFSQAHPTASTARVRRCQQARARARARGLARASAGLGRWLQGSPG